MNVPYDCEEELIYWFELVGVLHQRGAQAPRGWEASAPTHGLSFC